MKISRMSRLRVAFLTVCLLSFSALASGDSISFQLNTTSQSITSGGTAIFAGTVTNESGVDLNASDFFFNFANFSSALTPDQLLGGTDFPIPHNSTSGLVDLFSVMAGPVSPGAMLSMDVTLEDVNFDLSTTQTVSLDVPGSMVPEPTSLMLLGHGLFLLILSHPRTRG